MTDATVEASNLSKSFGDKQVLQGMSFGVSPGDVIGVLGKNGAGKTTLLELMLGFTPPTGGAVRVFGHESYSLPGSIKARVGFVPQQDELLDQLTVADQLRVIASFYPRWDSALIDAPVRRVGRRYECAHQEHVGGRAAEAVDPARVRAQTGSADPR